MFNHPTDAGCQHSRFSLSILLMKNITLGQIWLPILLFCVFPSYSQSNILLNSNFEDWEQISDSETVDSIPSHWSGSVSSLFYPEVSRTEDSFSGLYACRMVHTQKAYARFSTQDITLSGGIYTLQFFVKGKGIIRNGYYNGYSYSNYSTPDTISSNSWKKIQYQFNLKNSLSLPVQLIFSISQTDASGLIIDNASLISHTITGLPDLSGPEYYVDGSVLHLSLSSVQPVSVYDLFGNLIYTSENNTFSIPLSTGVYLVCISGKKVLKIRM